MFSWKQKNGGAANPIDSVLDSLDRIALEHAQQERRKFTEIKKTKVLESRISQLEEQSKHTRTLLKNTQQQLAEDHASLEELKLTAKSLRQAVQTKRELIRFKQQADILEKVREDNARKKVQECIQQIVKNEKSLEDVLRMKSHAFQQHEELERLKQEAAMKWEIIFLKNRQKKKKRLQKIEKDSSWVIKYPSNDKSREPLFSSMIPDGFASVRPSAQHHVVLSPAVHLTSGSFAQPDSLFLRPKQVAASHFDSPLPQSTTTTRQTSYGMSDQASSPAPKPKQFAAPHFESPLPRSTTAIAETSHGVNARVSSPFPRPKQVTASHFESPLVRPTTVTPEAIRGVPATPSICDLSPKPSSSYPSTPVQLHKQVAVERNHMEVKAENLEAFSAPARPERQSEIRNFETPPSKIRIVPTPSANVEEGSQLLKLWLQKRADAGPGPSGTPSSLTEEGKVTSTDSGYGDAPIKESVTIQVEPKVGQYAAAATDHLDDQCSIADSGFDGDSRSVCTTPYTPRLKFQLLTPKRQTPNQAAVNPPAHPDQMNDDEDSDAETPISQASAYHDPHSSAPTRKEGLPTEKSAYTPMPYNGDANKTVAFQDYGMKRIHGSDAMDAVPRKMAQMQITEYFARSQFAKGQGLSPKSAQVSQKQCLENLYRPSKQADSSSTPRYLSNAAPTNGTSACSSNGGTEVRREHAPLPHHLEPSTSTRSQTNYSGNTKMGSVSENFAAQSLRPDIPARSGFVANHPEPHSREDATHQQSGCQSGWASTSHAGSTKSPFMGVSSSGEQTNLRKENDVGQLSGSSQQASSARSPYFEQTVDSIPQPARAATENVAEGYPMTKDMRNRQARPQNPKDRTESSESLPPVPKDSEPGPVSAPSRAPANEYAASVKNGMVENNQRKEFWLPENRPDGPLVRTVQFAGKDMEWESQVPPKTGSSDLPSHTDQEAFLPTPHFATQTNEPRQIAATPSIVPIPSDNAEASTPSQPRNVGSTQGSIIPRFKAPSQLPDGNFDVGFEFEFGGSGKEGASSGGFEGGFPFEFGDAGKKSDTAATAFSEPFFFAPATPSNNVANNQTKGSPNFFDMFQPGPAAGGAGNPNDGATSENMEFSFAFGNMPLPVDSAGANPFSFFTD